MKTIYILNQIKWLAVLTLLCILFAFSCEEELPEAGSLPDDTPPEASFSYSSNETDYTIILFSNLSVSASDYAWDFGDGNTSTEKEPTHTYAADGSYEVTLSATDKNKNSSTSTQTIEIVEPEDPFTPVILNAGFDEEGEDSYRDHWRNGDLGGVLQITSSPVHEGEKAGKFPSAGDRIAYQLITVEADKDYVVSFYYTMKDSPAGTLSAAILAGHVTDPTAIADATIASVELNDQTDADTYVLASLPFNSGDNTEVAIFLSNVGVECRFDSFTIVED